MHFDEPILIYRFSLNAVGISKAAGITNTITLFYEFQFILFTQIKVYKSYSHKITIRKIADNTFLCHIAFILNNFKKKDKEDKVT